MGLLYILIVILMKGCTMLGPRQPKARRFSYEPLYYDPKKEEQEGKKIKFKRNKSKAAARNRSLIWLFFLILIVIYLIYFVGKLGQN